jgi:O-antigen/teichoic acid export membrane protein
LLSGTAAGQLVGYLAYPVILAIYSPAQFGEFSTVVAVATPLAVVFTLRLDMAVNLADTDERARSVTAVTIAWVVCLGLGLSGVLLLARLAVGTDTWAALGWLWQAPLVATLLAAVQLLVAVAVRERRFGLIAGRSAAQGVLTAVLQIGLGWLGALSAGLVVGLAVSTALAAVTLGWALSIRAALPRQPLHELRRTVAHDRQLIANLTPATLLNSLSLWLPVVVVAWAFGPSTAGVFALAQRLLGVPVGLMIQVIGQVFVADASAEQRQGADLSALFRRTSVRLAAITAVGWLVVVTVGPALTRWAFGPEWTGTADLLRALSLGVAVQLVVSPVSQTLALIGHARDQLLWDVARFVAVATALLVTCVLVSTSIETVAWALSLVSAVLYALLWVVNAWRVRQPDADPAPA